MYGNILELLLELSERPTTLASVVLGRQEYNLADSTGAFKNESERNFQKEVISDLIKEQQSLFGDFEYSSSSDLSVSLLEGEIANYYKQNKLELFMYFHISGLV